MASVSYHKPVLLREVIRFLKIKDGGWYVDATMGDGGHSVGIIKLEGKVLGIDVDKEALHRVEKRFEDLGFKSQNFKLVLGNFSDLRQIVKEARLLGEINGFLFDLGVSSLQLEEARRGFSFSKVGPLDMRMDQTLSVGALDLVNVLNKGELYELFTKLGEERFAWRIVDALVSARALGTIQSTKDLADLVAVVYRRLGKGVGKIHPATRVFQALRIAVNGELENLKEVLAQTLEFLRPGGRVVILSYHSLEDRIVKRKFKEWQDAGLGVVLTKKPLGPKPAELSLNPKSRSVKMRVFEKL